MADSNNPMMNAILKWSLQHHDGTSDSVPTEMDREKKEFLENAMKTMVEDETKTLKELVEAIKEPEDTEEQVEKKENALEDLIDRSDRVDYAIALHSFANGLFPTINLLETSQHEGVRSKAAELVALAVQNNPPCQAWAFEGGALPKLLALHEKGTEKEKQKSLLALSGLISNNPPAQEAFIKADGLKIIESDIKENVGRRLKVKAIFTCGWMMRETEAALQAALACSIPEDLAAAAAEEDEELSTLAMTALLPLLKKDARCVRDNHAALAAAVKKRAAAKATPEADEEAIAAAKELAGLLA